MRVPVAWLSEYCDPGLAPEELADRLAMTGTEVERVVDSVLELAVTPNRVDCFGVYGVAREVHAVTGAPLAPAPWLEGAEATGDRGVQELASVEVLVPELCPRFTARVFTDVKIGPSPDWLQERLVAAGQRPINNAVDITNYVMLLTAQPMHVFDLDKVAGAKLVVRRAEPGETMVTLDGEEYRLDGESVVICDANGPTSLAGIKGGKTSEVDESTTNVLLEAATWDGVNILRTSSLLSLRSDASTRFEKQLHPALCERGQAVASRLMVELSGAVLQGATIDVVGGDGGRVSDSAKLRAGGEADGEVQRIGFPASVSSGGLMLRTSRMHRLLGEEIPTEMAATYLERLGFEVEREGEDLRIQVPPDRWFDVTREADLIEEVARVHGLDKLPTTLPAARERVGRLSRRQVLTRRVEDVLRDLGLDEIVGWSFADAGLVDRLRLGADDPRRGTVALANPISEDHSVMRPTLLGGLLDAARRNFAHGADRVALFESGRVYLRRETAGDSPAAEPHRIGALAAGPSTDFFSLKAVLESLAGQLGADFEVEAGEEPFLHPGRSAVVRLGGEVGGWIGELHPLVVREWDLESGVAFEVDLDVLLAVARAGEERYEDVTSFPAVYQDIAVVVEEEVPAARVRQAVVVGGGDLLRSAEVFDVYRGEQVGEGRKSLALRLELRAPDRTLTDADAVERREAIEAALAEIGGSLRA